MLKCDYCGRHFKNELETCPACGSSSFKHVTYFKGDRITEVPKDGYHVTKPKIGLAYWLLLLLGIIFLVFPLSITSIVTIVGLIAAPAEEKMFFLTPLLFDLPFLFVAILLLGISIYVKKQHKALIKKIDYLKQHGTLIKGLDYKVKNSNIEVNGNNVPILVVTYESKSGKTMSLESEPKYNGILNNEDGTVDLLIDENDYSNYYIDFEIY